MTNLFVRMGRAIVRPRIWVILILVVVGIALLGEGVPAVLLSIGIWGIAGVGLALVLGYAGQVALSQAAFVGAGAYTYAILTVEVEVPPLLALGGGALAAGALAALVSPILRVRGYYLAIATITLNLLLSALAISAIGVPGGPSGMPGVPYLSVFGVEIRSVGAYAVLALVVLAVIAVAAYSYYGRGRRWRMIQALGDDESLASGLGINVVGVKRELFTVSGVLAGLAGGILAAAYGFISPGQFAFTESLRLALAVFIGGAQSLWGAVLGVALLEVTRPLLGDAQALHGVIVGIVALLTVRFAPDGWIRRRPDQAAKISKTSTPSVPSTRPGAVGASEAPVIAREVASDDEALAEQDTRTWARHNGAEVRTNRLGRSFGSLHAVKNVNLRVAPGTVTGLIGPNGAGKTTLLNLIAGEVGVGTGTVELDGDDITFSSVHQRARMGLRRTYQQSRIITSLPVIDNILLGTDALRAHHRGSKDKGELRDLAVQAAVDAGAEHLLSKPSSSLTFGERRLVELARLLVSQPRLALLDEPVSGLSQTEGEALARVIRTLRSRGTTVILVEHAIPFVLSLADSLVVLHEGAVLAAGEPAEVVALESVRKSYLGSVLEEESA